MIDLSTWDLTIPVGKPATEIDTPLLVAGYNDDYFQNINGRLFFWAPVNGTTTKNAKYPRSELRETYADSTKRNWKYQDADNTLAATLKVTQVPSTGKIVIGQIHNVEGDDPPLKVQYQYSASSKTGKIVAIYRQKTGTDSVSTTLLDNVPMNQWFSYTIRLTKSGTLAVYTRVSSGLLHRWSIKLDSTWSKQTMYFKAGAYVQDNSGDTSEGGTVVFHKLQITHK